ncbi:hypothetical protein Pmar_PMAR023331 [Perkinsus marinus ATCC 50983]|uniref:Uncharacterized protein n=1 Tax=Perkinsus marinus (strain ATCC 50983 / TXsc) TaxID=423536 RepID=C5KK96_PERM5|nr:hypothetical protein Pmar_PMAR023331 [Perkinsus marinus ATCC 50983]EER15008.1 hypothetical protein Pmar_PMAR023331 [Perkinsus marinus ATCC 50983]|eukprot:XP_002783212.1 hypothetical protein Pmar_PMAR023331 [Perkinsus marinus ATCC 50983]
MRTVALLLKGIWLNQDEFRTASKGGGNAKGKFLEKLSECTYYGDPEYVMVDRINTQLRHRSDIYYAICPCDGEYPEIIYLQWSHPGDTAGGTGEADVSPFDPIKGRKYFDVCAKNVRNRHGKHKSIDRYADIDFILGSTASQAEPISKEELAQFSVSKLCDIDVTLPRREMVERTLEVLGKGDEFSEEEITVAMREVARIEKNIVPVGTGKGGQPRRSPPSECYRPQQHTSWSGTTTGSGENLPSLVGRSMFQLELTRESQRLLRRAVGKGWGYMATKGIVPKDEFHVTLLYVDSSNAFDHYSMSLVRQLWPRIGDSFGFTTAFAVCSDVGVCAAPVQFLQAVPCGNLYPHITLGVSPQASAKDSNDMLEGKHPLEALRVLELELSGNQTQLELRGVLRVSE